MKNCSEKKGTESTRENNEKRQLEHGRQRTL